MKLEVVSLNDKCVSCRHYPSTVIKGVTICSDGHCQRKISFLESDLSVCNCETTSKCTFTYDYKPLNYIFINDPQYDCDSDKMECILIDCSYMSFCKSNVQMVLKVLEACDYNFLEFRHKSSKADKEISELKGEIKELKGLITDMIHLFASSK